jgi:threonyl-tRNA synthetase
MKIPVLAVIGTKEAETATISLRSRRDGDLGSLSVVELIDRATGANRGRRAGLVEG